MRRNYSPLNSQVSIKHSDSDCESDGGSKSSSGASRGVVRQVDDSFSSGETGVGNAGFEFLQNGEIVVGGVGFEFLKKRRNRRWECRFQKF